MNDFRARSLLFIKSRWAHLSRFHDQEMGGNIHLKWFIGVKQTLDVFGKFERKHQRKSNFLEHGIICRKVRDFLEWKEKPNFNHVNPNYCMLNIIFQKDTKGVPTIYRLLLGKYNSIIEKAWENWNEKLDHMVETFGFRKSFSRINMFDDIYLRYIQFRTLHRRFFTNNLLHKMRIKDSNMWFLSQRRHPYDRLSTAWTIKLSTLSNALGIDKVRLSDLRVQLSMPEAWTL